MEPAVPTTAAPNHATSEGRSEGSALRKGYSPETTEKALQKDGERKEKKKKKRAGFFFPKFPEKFEAASTQPPSSLHSQALTASLFLTLLHRQKSPFIFHLFSFLPERQRRVGLLCTTNTNRTFFCSALGCGLLPPMGTHT